MATREGDTALWLHNKLGSTDDLWSGNSICSQLTQEKLLSIQDCFHNLQPYVKVKLMLAFLHLPKRNVEEWRAELEDILQMAQDDTDQWVAMVGNILKTYPTTGALNTEIDDHHNFFHQVLIDLKKLVKKSQDAGMQPMECLYLSKNANLSVAGQLPHQNKHFQLKRKPKSAALRAELLQKSSEAAINIKKTGGPSAMPFKFRSFAKKMDEEPAQTKGLGVMRGPGSTSGFLKANTLSRSFSGSSMGQRQNQLRREGGIKLLDIGDVPVAGREAKRRKRLAEQEAAEARKMAEKEAASATPDYAAGLIPTVTAIVSAPVTVTTAGPSYVPNARLPASSTPGIVTLPSNSLSAATQLARENLQSQLQQQLMQKQAAVEKTTITIVSNPQGVNQQPAGVVPVQPKPPGLQQQPSTAAGQQQQQPAQPSAAQLQQSLQQPAKKPGLCLTREQMVEAQEMFRTSNKVTRPEKALILGFMAGSRENPCPQQGEIVNIRLSETNESVQQPDGLFKPMIVDVYFQMNYNTGEWKRIKKFRDLEADFE